MNDEEVSLLKSILWDLAEMVDDLGIKTEHALVRDMYHRVVHKINQIGVAGKR